MRIALVAALVAAVALFPSPARATGTVYLQEGANGGSYAVRTHTIQELRLARIFRTTVRQQYDFSCGSAALATLLTYHYNRPVSEETVFRFMYDAGDQGRIQQEGFSLLDMKRYLEQNGYQADGFDAPLEQLVKAEVPAIVLIRENGYNHFVVVKGLYQDKVLIGDPSAGTRILMRPEFEAMWHSRILFVIRSHTDVARFNNVADWNFRQRAPLGDALSREGVGGMLLMLPTRDMF